MAAFSDYLENKLIDHLLRTATFSQPSVVAIALCTSAPTDASTGATITEVTNSNGYSRKTINPSNSNWAATQGGTSGASSGIGGSTSNAVVIEFPAPSGSWGTITHVAVCDSATWGAGNVLFYCALASPALVSVGEAATIDVGDLTFTIGPCNAESYVSDYLENKLIDHLLRTTTFTQPPVIAIALCTAAPTQASTGATIAEVANSNGYTRKTLDPSNSNWAATQGGTSGASSGTDGATSNAVAIEFDEATDSWGTITHVAVCDSATWGAGNVLFFGKMPTPELVASGDTVAIDVGDLTLIIGPCPAVTYNCVDGDCVDPGDGTGEFATLAECQAVCSEPIEFSQMVQRTDFLNGFSDGNVIQATLNNVAEGSLLVVVVGVHREGQLLTNAPIITCNLGTLTFVYEIENNISNPFDPGGPSLWMNTLYVYYIENAPAGDYIVSATITGNIYPVQRYATFAILEYHNVVASDSLFAQSSNTGIDESPTITPPARNSTDDLIVTAWYLGDEAHDIVLESSEYTKRYPLFQLTVDDVGIADYLDAASPPPVVWSMDWQIEAYGPHWLAAALSFKKAPP